MSGPSSAEILAKSFAVLSADAAFVALAGTVYNHAPQDTPLPFCRLRWADAQEWDTKDSEGLEGWLTVDVWTDHRGDKIALQAVDRAIALLHLQPFALTSAQGMLLRREMVAAFTEPDGLTHHSLVRFRLIATT